MEKYILRKDEATANALATSIETEVLPVVKSLADKLAELGIDSEVKNRIAELFTGNYGTIEAAYRKKLEDDAALFKTLSAQEGIISQLHDVMADLEEFVAEELSLISYKEVGGVKLTDPAILDYWEFKKGVPVVGKEQKTAILEHYTTYVQTEIAAELHKKHREVTVALTELRRLCSKAGVQFVLPVQFFGLFFRNDEDGFTATEIDYDEFLRGAAPSESPDKEDNNKIIHTSPQEPRFLDVGSKPKGSKTI